MFDWIAWFCDTSQFTDRSQCGPGWTDQLVFLHRFMEMSIFIVYLLIPAGVWRLWIIYTKKRGPLPKAANLFPIFLTLFVVSCGLTHLMGWFAFVWPAYRLDALVLSLCALFSWATVWSLISLTRREL